jgi:hypothetical protein
LSRHHNKLALHHVSCKTFVETWRQLVIHVEVRRQVCIGLASMLVSDRQDLATLTTDPHLDPPLPGVNSRGTPPVWGVHRTQCAQVVTGRCLGGRDRGYPQKVRFYPFWGVAGLTKQYIFWQTSPTIGYPPLPPFQKWGFPLIIPKLTKKSVKKWLFWGQKCENNDRNRPFPEFPTFCTFSCFWVAFWPPKTTPIKV